MSGALTGLCLYMHSQQWNCLHSYGIEGTLNPPSTPKIMNPGLETACKPVFFFIERDNKNVQFKLPPAIADLLNDFAPPGEENFNLEPRFDTMESR